MENLLTRNVKNLSMCLSIINVFELVRSLKPTYTQFPFGTRACSARTTIFIYATAFTKTAPSRASLIETPVLWLGRLCIFYALLKAGLAGSHANPLVSELKISDGNDSADLGFSKWTHAILEKPETKR
ncbi:hypothetical protein AAHE18_01G055200 [Arachis hypogaea]